MNSKLTKKHIIIIILIIIIVPILSISIVLPFASPKNTEDKTETTTVMDDGTEVSASAEVILMEIAEDVAEQIAENPNTVSFSTFEWGFSRQDREYAVQGTFKCSNLMGVEESHILQVWCKASEDYSKIQPYKVILDDTTLVNITLS